MILVVPVVVSTVARLSGRLPLTARYAARDAARHRTRTVPAVAAVAATVAGVVALGIATTSQERANEKTYAPQAQMGTGRISWGPDLLPGEEATDPAQTWNRIEEAVHRSAPEVTVRTLQGPNDVYVPHGYTSTYVEVPREWEESAWAIQTFDQSIGVADTADDLGMDPAAAAVVDRALAAGRAVVFTDSADTRTEVTIRQETWSEGTDEPDEISSHDVPAQLVVWDQQELGPAPASTVLPMSLARQADLEVVTRSLRLIGDLDTATETRIKEAVQGAVDGTYLYVERGYQRPPEVVVVLLVLGALGGVLMLGGTLTATFLALSDAKPDLATLSAVGAAPRTRRRVAAAYALVVGLVGAILGAAVGFIPGIAISRPLTASLAGVGPSPGGSVLVIPWLLIAVIVVALPLLTAAIVGVTARSRLPLVARLD